MSTAVLDAPPPLIDFGDVPPRYVLTPASVSSAAQDCIDIYEVAGGKLDDWQEGCLRNGCLLRADLNWASFENCVVVPRQNGKGAVIEALILASLFVWGNAKTVYAAHRLDTAQSTFSRVRALIETTPELARRCKQINDSDYSIELLTGGIVEFKTRTASGGRGLTGDLVILDEGLELNIDQITALVPILAAKPFAQLWYFSTAPKFSDQHICLVRARALESDADLSWVDWGVERGADINDPEVQKKANPAYGIRITPERLVQLRKILGEEGFATECMGIFPEMSAGSVLSPSAWKGMKDVESKRAPDSDVVMGLDMTPLREFGGIGMHGFREDGLEHLQIVDYAPGIDWMVTRAGLLHEALDPALWVIDGRNGVKALLPELEKVGIKVLGPAATRALLGKLTDEDAKKPVPEIPRGSLLVLPADAAGDAVGQFIDAFRRNPTVFRHKDQEPLNLAVPNAQPKVGDAGQIMWTRKLSEVDIGPVVLATNTRYGSHLWLNRPKAKPMQKPWVV